MQESTATDLFDMPLDSEESHFSCSSPAGHCESVLPSSGTVSSISSRKSSMSSNTASSQLSPPLSLDSMMISLNGLTLVSPSVMNCLFRRAYDILTIRLLASRSIRSASSVAISGWHSTASRLNAVRKSPRVYSLVSPNSSSAYSLVTLYVICVVGMLPIIYLFNRPTLMTLYYILISMPRQYPHHR